MFSVITCPVCGLAIGSTGLFFMREARLLSGLLSKHKEALLQKETGGNDASLGRTGNDDATKIRRIDLLKNVLIFNGVCTTVNALFICGFALLLLRESFHPILYTLMHFFHSLSHSASSWGKIMAMQSRSRALEGEERCRLPAIVKYPLGFCTPCCDCCVCCPIRVRPNVDNIADPEFTAPSERGQADARAQVLRSHAPK